MGAGARRGKRDIAVQCEKCYNTRMNTTLKITKIGNSAGIILPKDILNHLQSELGDELTVSTTPRGIELTAPDDDFEQQMKIAREIMRKRKRALAELAK